MSSTYPPTDVRFSELKSVPTTLAGYGITDKVVGDFRAYKSADESLSSTTLQDDDHLTVGVASATKYRFKFYLFVNTAGAVEGLKLAIGGTCTATSMKASMTILDDVAGTTAVIGRVTALASSVGVAISLGNSRATIEGTIEVNAAGTFLLSWAQFAGLGVAATTVQRGSYLVVERLV